MVVERRTDDGVKVADDAMEGDLGVYIDRESNPHIPYLNVKGSRDSETKLPIVVEHQGTCYVDLPGLADTDSRDLKDPHLILASKVLMEIGLKCAKSVKTIFLVFNLANFKSGSTKTLDDSLNVLRLLLKNVSSPHAIHLVMNNKDEFEKASDEELSEIAATVRSFNKERRLRNITRKIIITRQFYQKKIIEMEQDQKGWLPTLRGRYATNEVQDSAKQALLNRYRQTKDFLSKLSNSLNLYLCSLPDQEAINETVRAWNNSTLVERKFGPLLIRDVDKKRWILRAIGKKNRVFEDPNFNEKFSAQLAEISFDEKLTVSINTKLESSLELALYGEINVCKVILFNPIDLGETRKDLKKAIEQGGYIPASEFNFSDHTKYQALSDSISCFIIEFASKVEKRLALMKLQKSLTDDEEKLRLLKQESTDEHDIKDEEKLSILVQDLLSQSKGFLAESLQKRDDKKKELERLRTSAVPSPFGSRISHDYNSYFFWETFVFDLPKSTDGKPVPLLFSKEHPEMSVEGNGRWYTESASYNSKKNSYSAADLKNNWRLKEKFYDPVTCKFKAIFRSAWRDRGKVSIQLYIEERYTKYAMDRTTSDPLATGSLPNELKTLEDDITTHENNCEKYKTQEGAISNYPKVVEQLEQVKRDLSEVNAYLRSQKAQAFAICFLIEKMGVFTSDEIVDRFVKACKQNYDMVTIELEDVAAVQRIDTSGRPITFSSNSNSPLVTSAHNGSLPLLKTVTTHTSAIPEKNSDVAKGEKSNNKGFAAEPSNLGTTDPSYYP